MNRTQRSPKIRALVLAGTLLFTTAQLQAQDEDTPGVAREAAPPAQEMSPELMRSFLHLQEQVHATQMAVERSRAQAEAAEERSTEALNARLEVIESALEKSQQEHTTALQEANRQLQTSNQNTMFYASLLAALGFAALAITGWLQWKTAQRLTHPSLTAGFPALTAPAGRAFPSLPQVNPTANLRLMDALGRLEHRIAELELERPEMPSVTGSGASATGENTTSTGADLAALIAEGEQLLAREEAEKAIQHFDAILSRHPGHPEVLLHKGAALERLRRDQEAIQCYDLAIQADKNLTMAYLHKGGLYNRMERFSEAMECYEQALKVQEGRTPVT